MVAVHELSSSQEDYLEAIFHIIKEKQAARVKDIAARLKVKAASVTGALRSLAERGLINYAPYELITFTPAGQEIAVGVVKRHKVLKEFFVKVLSIDPAEADSAACQMEHSITKPILERFIQFVDFVETCPRAGSKWISGFGYYCDNGSDHQNCEQCLNTTLDEHKKKHKGETSMQQINLKKLKPGQKGKVAKMSVGGLAGKRLVEMGMIAGTTVTMVRVAPLGDPIEIKLKGYNLSLRKEEAEGIYVEALS